MSPAHFADHVEYYVKKGISSFIFYDDTFTVNKKRAGEICRIFIERKLKIQWKCFTRVDCLSMDLLRLMKDAGCYYVMFGCNSMNPKTLANLKKGFTVDQCFEGIGLAHEAGMVTSSSFMIGLPYETEDDIPPEYRCVARIFSARRGHGSLAYPSLHADLCCSLWHATHS